MNQGELWAKEMLGSNAVIIDTETTGLDGTAQIIQIAIIDMKGKVLFDSLLRPSCKIQATATATHGMTLRHVAGAPKIADVIDRVRDSLSGRTVLVYNAAFDTRMLRQTLEAFKLDAAWLDQIDFQCAMKRYTQSLGIKTSQKLEGGDHTALGDCWATLNLLHRMAGLEKGERVLTPSQQAYIAIKRVLANERDERQRTFRDTKQYEEEVGEIDNALKALEVLGITIRDLQSSMAAQGATQAKLLG